MIRALLVAGLAALALAAPAAARESYCSPSGDYCTSVKKLKHVRYLRVGTFSFRGRVKICVKDPKGARVCRSVRLRNTGTLYEGRIRWKGNYPDRGHGLYLVTFFYGATKLGPRLSFRL